MTTGPTLTRLELAGRCLLASLFILDDVARLLVLELYRAIMVDAGLTPMLLPAVIALELGSIAQRIGFDLFAADHRCRMSCLSEVATHI